MRRGRPPKPADLKLLTGNPGKRPVENTNAAVAVLEDLTPPEWLDGHGKAFWNHYAPILARLRLISELDGYLLAAASERWSVYLRASEEIKQSLTQQTDSNGNCARPEVAISKGALDSCRAILQEFGIGPASRTKVQALIPKKKDKFQEFMNRRAAS